MDAQNLEKGRGRKVCGPRAPQVTTGSEKVPTTCPKATKGLYSSVA